MAAPMKTPGVYVVEKSAFPNSVVEVATAVPAFIGYTEKADNKGRPLNLKPWPVASMAEFEEYFGKAPPLEFTLATGTSPTPAPVEARRSIDFRFGDKDYLLEPKHKGYLLHACMKFFFMNGGGRCYVVSVGKYDDDEITSAGLEAGIPPLLKEQEPTMLLAPEAVSLTRPQCASVQTQMLKHCAEKMRSRIAVFDLWGGFREPVGKADDGNPVAAFRNDIPTDGVDFGAAYYPWLETTVVGMERFGVGSLDTAGRAALRALIETELELAPAAAAPAPPADGDADGDADAPQPPAAAAAVTDPRQEEVTKITGTLSEAERLLLDKTLTAMSKGYKAVVKEMREHVNLLPPAAAMAGIMTMVDNSIGVWKAPANVSVASVVKPAVQISHDDQQDLNVTPQGKSINAIRSFVGEGTLVWGARTLDGNSLDWRYVNVRRTMIMLEQSIGIAAKAYVFDPNVANTWVTVKSMIRNFLTGIWKRGGLAGASPDAAFNVYCGLGETMTPEDILEGIMRVTVLVAPTRPAEFIEITFQQKMQES